MKKKNYKVFVKDSDVNSIVKKKQYLEKEINKDDFKR